LGGRPTPLFVFSLPRSGSTLAQRVLASHGDIATVSEPWILLPYFYTLRTDGVYAEYNHSSVALAVEDFCDALPGGREDYVAELRELALRLYGRASRNGERYFLDKTPRYHLISDDVVKAFPDGKHVFLWRNPLSVIASIVETWGAGKWNIHRHKIDLFDGVEELVRAYERNRDLVHPVRYEDLVTAPERTWEQVFRYLDLPFDAAILEDFRDLSLKGRKGDPTGTGRYTKISREPLERWRGVLNNPVRKAWCRRYLRWLGSERLAMMGYDLEGLLRELDSLPTSYRGVGSDVWRSSYGITYDLLEPKIFRQKLRKVPAWKRIHVHK
jgi:hypothetical protein